MANSCVCHFFFVILHAVLYNHSSSKMYTGSDKICDLMSHEEDAIQIISRFGLSTGVADQTIAQACEVHGVHTPTFLSIVNYKVFRQRAIPAECAYLFPGLPSASFARSFNTGDTACGNRYENPYAYHSLL